MNKSIKLLTVASVMLLSSCANVGQTSSFGERLSDSFLLTSASDVPTAQTLCISLSQPYSFKSGSVTINMPAGTYKSIRKNSSGYFFYAPSPITSDSAWSLGSSEGVYLNNAMTSGDLFARKVDGFDDRPIRSVVLPSNVISRFKKMGKCY